MASQEEQARMLAADPESEAGEVRRAWRPLAKGALGFCLVLAAAAALWRVGGGTMQATSAEDSKRAGIFLAEKKEAKKQQAPSIDPEKLKADVAEAHEKEDEMREEAQADSDTAEAIQKKADGKKNEAQKFSKGAKDKHAEAAKDKEDAKKLLGNAKDNVASAAQMEAQASSEREEGNATLVGAKKDLKAALKNEKDAQEMVDSAQKQMDGAEAVELKAMETTAAQRACFDLPAVRLAEVEGSEADFDPVVTKKEVGTPEQCTAWCLKHDGCAQSIFVEGNKTCSLFKQSTSDVWEFFDGANSSICGPADGKEELEAMMKTAFSHQPYVPPVVTCSWDGEDCSQTKCCNDEDANWDFSEIKPYTCFGSGEKAMCMSACYSGDCGNRGTGREAREIEKAGDGVLTQGSTLYCFMVVVWSKPEGKLAKNAEEKGASIYECDDYDLFEGSETALTEWKTYINADMFIDMWKQVQKSGKYAEFDWTVKVDADAVFFPEILKQHLEQLRTPRGSRVYLRNADHTFGFLGALEVFSKPAITHYFEQGWVCEQKKHEKQGEDYFMKHCLDAIGTDHQTEVKLLSDMTTDPKATKLDCSSGWTAAFHRASSVDDWNKCHGQAMDAQAAARKLWIEEHGEQTE